MLTLSIKDRLQFEQFLPKKGSFIDIKISRDLRGKIELSQEEMKRVNLRDKVNDNGMFSILWDSEKDFEVDIDITDMEKDLLKKELNSKDKKGELDNSLFDLALKIKEL